MITSQQLIAVNLRYGTVAKSLKALAFSDISAKALFLLNKPLNISEISKTVAVILGVKKISPNLVEKGLLELKSDGRVRQSGDKWSLLDSAKQEIEKEVAQSEDILSRLLKRNFPGDIDTAVIHAWFINATSDFFIYNGDEWVQSICKGSGNFAKGLKTLDELLDPSIKKHKLGTHSNQLKDAFRGFLESHDKEDQRYLVNIGYAMFSARLVAADVGADPITLEELRGSYFLVDTNFFYALQLDSSGVAESMQALGEALKEIDAKLLFLHETEEEYGRVLVGKKGEILKLIDVYPFDVVIDSDDRFIVTAISRKCKDKSDFERFFGTLGPLPKEMVSGLLINKLDDPKTNATVAQAKGGADLKKLIQKWCLKMRPFWNRQPKSNSALGHDAALVLVTESERASGKKIYILTLDRSLQACCAERAGNHNLPAAIYMEGLIQILAANNAGPGVDAANFAPLLTNILLRRCIPPERMYSPQDLHWLYGIQKNVASFKPEKIKQIALEVTKARLAGKTATDEKLQRTIHRLYQEEIKHTTKEVEEAHERARSAEQESTQERTRRSDVESRLGTYERKETLRKACWVLAKTLLWRLLGVIIFGVVVYYIFKESLNQESLLSLVLGFLTFFLLGYKFLKKPISHYLETKHSLSEK